MLLFEANDVAKAYITICGRTMYILVVQRSIMNEFYEERVYAVDDMLHHKQRNPYGRCHTSE